MKDVILTILAVASIILLLFGIVFGLGALFNYIDQRACVNLGQAISYPTRFDGGYCFIELKEGFWVKQHEILYVLPLLNLGDCQ